jgi:hypothetical protein
MRKVKLYLDDLRTPKTNGWIIVRDYKEFVNYIQENGLPDVISFDHDLGHQENISNNPINQIQIREMNGYDCAKWVCNYCADNGLPLPEWHVHSANPVGAQNINHLLESYKKKFENWN